MQLSEKHREYWQRNLRITSVMLVVWALITFIPIYFARGLSDINIFGWPLPFYMGAQGSLVIYVIIIWLYARIMDKLDREYGVHEGE